MNLKFQWKCTGIVDDCVFGPRTMLGGPPLNQTPGCVFPSVTSQPQGRPQLIVGTGWCMQAHSIYIFTSTLNLVVYSIERKCSPVSHIYLQWSQPAWVAHSLAMGMFQALSSSELPCSVLPNPGKLSARHELETKGVTGFDFVLTCLHAQTHLHTQTKFSQFPRSKGTLWM